MNNKEFKKLEKEQKEWQNLKSKIKEQVSIVGVNNYDKDAFLFKILKIDNKKDKNNIIKIINSFEEDIFTETFNAMNNYFENTLRQNYVFIEDISIFHNLFGILNDRIKSNENYIKEVNTDIRNTKKQIISCKDYDKQQELKYSLWQYEDSIKELNKNINSLKSLYKQLKFDIKKLEVKKIK